MPHLNASRIWRTFTYAFYDWTREMPRSRRWLATTGLFLQGYAMYAMWTRSLIWPYMWPPSPFIYGSAWFLYFIGYSVTNVTLTWELRRKTQLESDQIAARQIQRTLHPQQLEKLPGYEMDMFYDPIRGVGGDYFDVIALPANQTLFAIADVSGKGMPAALLAANIQALVRSISSAQADPVVLARQINEHLNRYTPPDRFATAVFVVLNRESGTMTYVNAGHNAPMLFGAGAVEGLEATGLPLGLFSGAQYEARTSVLGPGGTLVLFTDGLPDSISDSDPEDRLQGALAGSTQQTMANLKALVDSQLKEDDVTILLVKRTAR